MVASGSIDRLQNNAGLIRLAATGQQRTFNNSRSILKMQSSFNDATECYQAIGNALASASRTEWDSIVLNVTLDDIRIDTVVSCWKNGSNEPLEYLAGIPRLASHIYELARLVSTEEKGLFKKCHFRLFRDGKFDVEFSY